MNPQVDDDKKKVNYELVPRKDIFAPKTRRQKAIHWLFKRIKTGLLKYTIKLKSLAKGRVEELGIEIAGFPSWSNYFCIVYSVDNTDEDQRDDALIQIFRRYGLYIRNMSVFLAQPDYLCPKHTVIHSEAYELLQDKRNSAIVKLQRVTEII
jgi:hypothetical protein